MPQMPLPVVRSEPEPPQVDVLRWPVIGSFLRWRHARTAIQLVALAAAVAMVVHGLFGPQIAPRNLATVLTWVHYRGLLVVALLAAGNLFCTGCPFVLVRDGARRLHQPSRRWPSWLRRKWPGLVLFVGVLFVYELFDLWSLPRATAWLIVGYFGAAMGIDLAFKGASFCKYVCPIGQFNFIASTLSPLEVTVRDRGVCAACRTADCIKGRHVTGPGGTVAKRGCELDLFLPAKVGNVDCTFCLDCVQACPHDNVSIAARTPGAELVVPSLRSSLGRLAARSDIAALAVLFAFGAMINAFAMVRPVYALEEWLAHAMRVTTEAPVLAVIFLAGLAAAPAALLAPAALVSRRVGRGEPRSWAGELVRYAVALVPFGFSLWIAHYAFHLLTGALTIVPVTQSAAIDAFGRAVLGGPWWRWAGLRPGAVWPIQIGFVVLGAFGSIAVAHAISERDHEEHAAAATLPWALVVIVLAAAALWVLSNPMEMRGMVLPG